MNAAGGQRHARISLAGGDGAWNQRAFVATGASVSCVFAGFCTWHILLNRRALLRYVRAAGARAGSARRLPARETAAAAAVVGGVLALTVIHALAEG